MYHCNNVPNKFDIRQIQWSFGILMWEVYTKGDIPYFNMDHQKIKTFLRSEKRLPKPQFATDAL